MSNTLLKEKIDQTVDAIMHFANCILGDDTSGHEYSHSVIEFAEHLRIAVLFYRAREDKNESHSSCTI